MLCYSSAPWHRHTHPHCLQVTVETALFETCFICGRLQCEAGKEEKLPCESRNAKYSPQCHTAAITPAPGAGPRQWDDSLWCWGGEQFNSHLSCCIYTETLCLGPLNCCVQNECISIWYSHQLVSKHHNPIKPCLSLKCFLINEQRFFAGWNVVLVLLYINYSSTYVY